ncbi:uncharacterized protein IL334_000585 [Kwoniella shivajii]|uniref:Syntaxin n=1 Tax=Kwoniella shivajii TaxID=564305 RepID=A0ABZ1CQK9_9TREE|nr:hypothetical protein IL334_000585 [Kwoniella shivajii]
MSDIQNIKIISTETVELPKSHIVYVIQISTPTRTWTVQRRYSDFLDLHTELKSSVGKEPPGKLPGKTWNWRGLGDDKLIRERRILLEQYLSLLLTSKDSSFRSSYGFKDFLSIPSVTQQPTTFTSSSWLLEHTSLQALLRSARSSLLKRDALANMGDSTSSRSSGIESKRLLKDAQNRISTLSDSLDNSNLSSTLGQGEKKRREEMIQELLVEKSNLSRMAEAGVKTTFNSTSNSNANSGSNPNSAFSSHTSSAFAPSANGGGGSGGSINSIPGGFPHQGRVFGVKPQAPQETAETRPLDDRGLLQLQSSKIDNQDDQLKELSQILQRQKKMGEEIHQEIGQQNELLDDIESGVDKTGRKLGKTKRELNRLG